MRQGGRGGRFTKNEDVMIRPETVGVGFVENKSVAFAASGCSRDFSLGRHDIDLNRKHWSGRMAGFQYRNASDLFPAEAAMLAGLEDRMPEGPILDIGVGTGRTAPALRALGRAYTGIDYSPEMIRRARAQFPDVDFRHMDARDLSAFPDGMFALVCFSFNGIDYVPHADRLRILGEIRRVLAPGGCFCFSSHNRDYERLDANRAVPGVEMTLHPVKLAYRLALYGWSRVNALRLARHERREESHAILNDSALNHRLLTYYIAPDKQREQLARAGFADILAVDVDGRTVPAGANETHSYMIHYLCCRPADD